ncbi:MAG: transposase [Verrucomicrobiaceae bacterium]
MNTNGTKKRTFDEQFKRDAVALLEGGRKAAQLARELGISPGTCVIGRNATALELPRASLRRAAPGWRTQAAPVP